MRITFILSSLWVSGGVRDVVEYANRLTARGHDLALIIPGGTFDADMAAELHPDIDLHESDFVRPTSASSLQLAQLSWSMARAVPPSDVIISTHTPTTVPGFISTRLMRKGVPAWFFQDYLAMFEGRLVEKILLRNAVRWHRLTLTISEYAGREIREYAAGKIAVAGIGLSHAEVFLPVPIDEREHHATRRILYLGDERPRKGLYDFLAASAIVYEQMPNIELWIVSKERCDIRSELPFCYIYRPSRKELAKLYQSCDLFVSSSWWESLGIPPLEAMACATPVVMTNSGGVMDYAEPGDNCLLVPPKQPRQLADAMLRVLGDAELARRLSHGGPPTAARYDWERVTDGFEAALCEVVK